MVSNQVDTVHRIILRITLYSEDYVAPAHQPQRSPDAYQTTDARGAALGWASGCEVNCIYDYASRSLLAVKLVLSESPGSYEVRNTEYD